jgi:hypothetical protein
MYSYPLLEMDLLIDCADDNAYWSQLVHGGTSLGNVFGTSSAHTSDHFAWLAMPHISGPQRRLGEEIQSPTPNSDLIHDTSPFFSAAVANQSL